jgi:hypothetical protein
MPESVVDIAGLGMVVVRARQIFASEFAGKIL